MNLDEAQRNTVGEWVRQGLKLSEIQNKLGELGVKMTYMEVRLLVDDLQLTPKDTEPAKPAAPVLASGKTDQPPAGPAPGKTPAPAASPTGGVSVSVDQLARPGALVSGKVTFSDGHKADWYLDQSGRLGLVADQPGYRPSAGDVQQFQATLDSELSRMGF